jgi:TRAP-type C4-dicarboxylate transport system permease small subunit
MSADPTEGEGRRIRVHIPFYDDVLKILEVWILMALLFLVVGATFLNILDRNFSLGLWEYAVVEKMVYSFTFFLGLYGGVVASRRAKHIAIDAVTHFLKPWLCSCVSVFLQLVGAATCMVLSYAAYRWLYDTVDADATLLGGRTEWWLNVRMWRWPVIVAFGWMALHFLVNAGRFAFDLIKPPDAEPDPDREPPQDGEQEQEPAPPEGDED